MLRDEWEQAIGADTETLRQEDVVDEPDAARRDGVAAVDVNLEDEASSYKPSEDRRRAPRRLSHLL